VWARFSTPVQTDSGGPPSLLYNGYRVFPEVKERPGREADPSSPSSVMVKKGYSYTSTPPMGRKACTEPKCLYKGDLYLFYILHDVNMNFTWSSDDKADSYCHNCNYDTKQDY